MAPLTPHWEQPSHGDIQEVIVTSPTEFTAKSISKISVPPYGLFAKLSFPPCTVANEATYATVQMSKDAHLSLNSDLVYINHSCDPSLIFDMPSMSILAGAKGLTPGQELTFFYPSTEWSMAQGFDCFCGSEQCRGRISGAKDMSNEQLKGYWINPHIRDLLEERDSASSASTIKKKETEPISEKEIDVTEEALKATLEQARKLVQAAQKALDSYISVHSSDVEIGFNGHTRRGVTSREMSGEMGGDTLSNGVHSVAASLA
ncbi:hypothetical protein F5884DRAFT_279801 [Xylogone sp. PMI_703]|nr:hypothetical protein F5884DRAFT_279801 [Xylogone sp. PMI_703]